MEEDQFEQMQTMASALATMALRSTVGAINDVFGPGSAKIDSPLVAAGFAAQSQFLASLMVAASAGLDDDDDFEFPLDS